jgi:hypothetical protein
MNTPTPAPSTVAHVHQVTVNPDGVLMLVAAIAAVYLLALWAKARLLRGRLSRTVTRSFTPGTAPRRPSARAEHRMVTRSASSRHATRQFRKAALISALIAAVWLFAQLHPHH